MKVQGQNIDDLPFQAVFGVYGSWFGLICCVLCVAAQFYIAVAPIGAKPNANDFFINMLALPVVLIFYVSWKVIHRTKIVRLDEIDLVTGRRELDLAAAKQEEREEQATWSWWKKYVPCIHEVDLQTLLRFVLTGWFKEINILPMLSSFLIIFKVLDIWLYFI